MKCELTRVHLSVTLVAKKKRSMLKALSNPPPGLGWRDEAPVERLLWNPLGEGRELLAAPRGRITEITGVASSGRTSLLHGLMAASGEEFKAIIDIGDSFDPTSAEANGVRLDRLVWVRCGGNSEHALKSADLLLHAGGFGLVALDLCDLPIKALNRIPLAFWYRFQRTVEQTPTVFVVLSQQPQAKAAASLLVQAERDGTLFAGAAGFQLLTGVGYRICYRKPWKEKDAFFSATAIGG